MIFKKFKRDKFRRVSAGLGWPGSRPGCLLVVAEKIKKEKARYLLLDEYETSNLADLVTYAFDFQNRYKLECIYTDYSNGAMVDYAHRIRPQLSLSRAPYADSPDSLVGFTTLIRALTAPSQKKLHFNRRSNLPRLLLELSPERLHGGVSQFPFVAALGFAVVALEMNQPTAGLVFAKFGRGGGDWSGAGYISPGSDLYRFLMMDSPTSQRWESPPGGDWD